MKPISLRIVCIVFLSFSLSTTAHASGLSIGGFGGIKLGGGFRYGAIGGLRLSHSSKPFHPSEPIPPSLQNSVKAATTGISYPNSCSTRDASSAVNLYKAVLLDSKYNGNGESAATLASSAMLAGKSPSEAVSTYKAVLLDSKYNGNAESAATLASSAMLAGKSPSEAVSTYRAVLSDSKYNGNAESATAISDAVITCSHSKSEEKLIPQQVPVEAQSTQSHKATATTPLNSDSQKIPAIENGSAH